MADENKTPAASGASKLPASKSGELVLPDQILPPNLFLLPFNGPMVYPTLLAPLLVDRPDQIQMVEESISRNRLLGLIQTRADEAPEPTKAADVVDVGVVVKIIKRLKMPDGSINLLVHAMKRFRSKKVLSQDPFLVAEVEYLDDLIDQDMEMDALTRSVIGHVKKLSESNPFITDEMRLAMINAPGPGTVADLVAFAITLSKKESQDFLEIRSVKKRFEKLLIHLKREQEVADVQRKINDEVNTKITKLQREFFLKEQLKSIKRELGLEVDGKEKSAQTFKERIEAAGMPADVKKVALEELQKFETISEQSPEYNVSRTYLETLVTLPWITESKDNLDLEHARETLDSDHFGLDRVKDRIIEFLAVRKLKKDPKGSIICLVGPPGVGKTSIGKSVAKALGRTFYRFSLGGMRDEAEIKGHRRTYIGALPGKVINGMKRVGTRNPVILLDEIDKLGSSFQGDPASALLEVLDPEQNASFLDHYLDVPYDLSQVLFVVTANTTATIPPPLLDRMEVIELPGYTLEEKEAIATRYVIPKELEANGLSSAHLRIEKSALKKIISDYAREPGLRTFQQQINRIARKTAAKVAAKGKKRLPIIVVEEDLREWLGPKRFYNELSERIAAPGVAVGLAWTAMGGDILFIEATEIPGAGNLKLTGQMGEVMTESAAIAWSFVKKKIAAERGLDHDQFKKFDLHLHIPAGAIPKDGPSAGITMATCLYSLFTGRKIRDRLAMTGELSLIGKVLPVGGIKEKLLAAHRAGIRKIILPKLNEKDLMEVPDKIREALDIRLVSHIDEVLELALEDAPKTLTRRLSPKKSAVIRTKNSLKKRGVSDRLFSRDDA